MANIKYCDNYVLSKKFGKLKPIKGFFKRANNRRIRFFLCQCDCGNKTVVPFSRLNLKKTRSCGCSKTNEHFKTHGLTNHKLYNVWMSMKQRCYNKNQKRYSDWGGRGIKVCGVWKKDFKSFFDWSIKNGYAKGLQIDRINNDGNYEPENCRFVTPKENSNNRRERKDKK